jgi:hypothetical protein
MVGWEAAAVTLEVVYTVKGSMVAHKKREGGYPVRITDK